MIDVDDHMIIFFVLHREITHTKGRIFIVAVEAEHARFVDLVFWGNFTLIIGDQLRHGVSPSGDLRVQKDRDEQDRQRKDDGSGDEHTEYDFSSQFFHESSSFSSKVSSSMTTATSAWICLSLFFR